MDKLQVLLSINVRSTIKQSRIWAACCLRNRKNRALSPKRVAAGVKKWTSTMWTRNSNHASGSNVYPTYFRFNWLKNARVSPGDFQGISPVSNGTCVWFVGEDRPGLPGETESSSAGTQLDKGYPGSGAQWRVQAPDGSYHRGLFFESHWTPDSCLKKSCGAAAYGVTLCVCDGKFFSRARQTLTRAGAASPADAPRVEAFDHRPGQQ